MDRDRLLTRRYFFGKASAGLGIAALSSLLATICRAAGNDGLPGLPHFAPTAKRVIYLFQSGAPSQMDLFDYKPRLAGTRAAGTAGFGAHGTAADRHDVRRRRAFRWRPRCSSFEQHGAFGSLGQRTDAAPGQGRRRPLLHQVDVHRGDQPRSRGDFLPDGISARRPAVHRRVALLWPGQREPGSAGVRRDDLARQRQSERSAARRPAVGQRLSADAATRA